MSTEPDAKAADSEDSLTTHREELTGFQRDLLVAMDRLGETAGQRIKEFLEQTGYEELNHARLYANLDTLNHKGLVARRESFSDRRTKGYSLTSEGREALDEYREWVRADE